MKRMNFGKYKTENYSDDYMYVRTGYVDLSLDYGADQIEIFDEPTTRHEFILAARKIGAL